MLQILDYGICNVGAVQNILNRADVASKIIQDPLEINDANGLILPGVGHFATGMANLRARGFIDPIRKAVDQGKPLLGICLGMQLLARYSQEGDVEGLGLIPADVIKLDPIIMDSLLPVPHTGWSAVDILRPASFTAGMLPQSKFYFTHSYHMSGLASEHTVLSAHYGMPFVAGFQYGSISGVQFHPEKSHIYGGALLKSFAESVS